MVARSRAVAQYRARAGGKVASAPDMTKWLKKGGKAMAATGGKGQWLFVPSQLVVSKGAMKGHQSSDSKFLDKLGKVDASLKVWVGGLSEKTTWKKLEEHFKTMEKPTGCAIIGKGRACVAFKTATDVETAIATFNGSELDGKPIEVDVWTKREKKEGEEKPKRRAKTVIKTSFAKKSVAAGDRRNPKTQEKLKGIDWSLKIWVGGLDKKVTLKRLKEHFKENGCTPKLVDFLKPVGTAVCAFENEGEAETAVATINGTTLENNIIEIDSWKKPERKEKKSKEIA